MKLLCFFSFLLLNASYLHAQMTYVYDRNNRGNEVLEIGKETYTPITINKRWAIEYFQGGLNFWIPYPYPNYGNYKLFLKDEGEVGIGKKPSYRLDVAGDIAASGRFLTASDLRLKSNVEDLSGSLDLLLKLRPVEYKKRVVESLFIKKDDDFIKDSVKYITTYFPDLKYPSEKKKEFGFIAQEIQQIFPELVSENSQGYLSVNYLGLLPLIIESLQEQQIKIDNQHEKIQLIVNNYNNIKQQSNTNFQFSYKEGCLSVNFVNNNSINCSIFIKNSNSDIIEYFHNIDNNFTIHIDSDKYISDIYSCVIFENGQKVVDYLFDF